MSHHLLLTLSLLVSFAAYPVYAYGIYKEGVRPTRPTWMMILVSDLLLFCFMLAESRWDWLMLGFTAGNVMMLVAMGWSDVVASRAIRPVGSWSAVQFAEIVLLGRDRWTSKDITSVAIALCALALWAVTGSGVSAICFSLAGKIAASVPMWINLYREPQREKVTPWVLWCVGGTLYVLAIPSAQWSVTSLAAPIVFLILEIVAIALLLRAPKAQPETLALAA